MGTMWHDIAAQFDWAIRKLGYQATVYIPNGLVRDDVGQPVENWAIYHDVPVYLASTPHPSEVSGRVEDDTDWRWVYVLADFELKPGTEMEVTDAQGQNLGRWVVIGEPVRRPGHWRVKVQRVWV